MEVGAVKVENNDTDDSGVIRVCKVYCSPQDDAIEEGAAVTMACLSFIWGYICINLRESFNRATEAFVLL